MRPVIRHWTRRLRAAGSRLANDDRALVGQIDFLTSMVIRIIAFAILLAVAASLVSNAVEVDYSDTAVAERGASRLADDLLVTTPGEAVLNATCTQEFFEESTDHCGFDEDWANGGTTYLNAALAVGAERQLNVTITDSAGTITTINGSLLALGDKPPQHHGSVTTWHRHVGLDVTGNGTVRVYTITVSVWR